MTVRPFCANISAPLFNIYDQAYIRLATNSKIVSEHSIGDPLLRAVNNPFITLANGSCLKAADITSSEGL